MIIDGNGSIDGRSLLNNVQDLRNGQNVEKEEEVNKTESERDKVSLSGKAKEISQLKGLIGEIPDIRRDKVDALRKSIDTGTYNFDSLAIARNIIEEEL